MRLIANLLLLMLATTATAGDPALTPYQAVYSARYNGLPIEARRQLRPTDNGYEIITEARNFLGRIREEEQFHRDRTGRLVPDTYLYDRAILGKSRTETLAVDQVKGISLTRRKGREYLLDFSPGQLGPLSYQVAMARDLMAGKAELVYPVIHRGHLKEYRYRRIGEMELDTPLGKLRTVQVERVRDDSDRETLLWLAPKYHYLPVKLRQVEDGETYEMHIKSLTLNPASSP